MFPRVVALALLTAVVCIGTPTTSSALNYGATIIAGGFNFQYPLAFLNSVDVIGMDPIEFLPVGLCCNSLTIIGRKLYSCGGSNESRDTSDCFIWDTSDPNPQWQNSLQLPETMASHQAFPVGDRIWFVYKNNTLYDLDTKTNEFTKVSLPFYVPDWPCSTYDDKRRYVIGAGLTNTEIWINTDASDPSAWSLELLLPDDRVNSGCVLFEDYIYITGGDFSMHLFSIYNTQTGELLHGPPLEPCRQRHGSFVLDGKVAVVGGYDYEHNLFLSSIATYNLTTRVWHTENVTLLEQKDYFGLAQYFG